MIIELNKEQEDNFNKIFLRVLMQLAIETMDDLKGSDAWDGKMRVKMNDLYQMLDKNTKRYDEMYNATDQGTTNFYLATGQNVKNMMAFNLPEQTILCQMIEAFIKDEKSVIGIVKKVLNKPVKN